MITKRWAHYLHRLLCTTTALALASSMSITCPAIATSMEWTAPTEAASVDDNVVTVGSHRSATTAADILGLNSTSVSTNQLDVDDLSEAQTNDKLGVFGSSANISPDPYLANEFYNYYASQNAATTTSDVVAKDTGGSYYEYLFNGKVETDYGTPADLYWRPDIVLGVYGSPGTSYTMHRNADTSDAVNYESWVKATPDSSFPQGYLYVLNIRTWTDTSSLVGTTNSDGNTYQTSDYYKSGDESYDPIAIIYADNASDTYESCYYVDNICALAKAAQLVMQQQSDKTTRYDDPVDIANKYEQYAKATKWLVLKSIAAGTVDKKTVAVVSNVNSDDATFTLLKLNADKDSSALSNLPVAEAAQDTTTDLAASIDSSATAGEEVSATAAELMDADVIICMPPSSTTRDTGASSVKEVLSASGYTDESDYPSIFDNVVCDGTFDTSSTTTNSNFNKSVESTLLTGIVQGFIYPEIINPVQMMTYYTSELYHLDDSATTSFVNSEMAGVSLPDSASLTDASNVSDAVSTVQDLLDSATTYYYENKSSIDKTRPKIASTDVLDDMYGYGVADVTINVPDGATFTVTDNYGLTVSANSDGTYTLDTSDESTIDVTLDGYQPYSVDVTGATNPITITTDDMSAATADVTFNIPKGASLVVYNSDGDEVAANSDGTYTLSTTTESSFTVSLAGYLDYTASVIGGDGSVTVTLSDMTASSSTRAAKSITINKKTITAKLVKACARKAGATAKSLKKITLGKKVKKIAPKAFAKYKKVKTLVVKTKKLTKRGVKGAFKGSSVKAVKVFVGRAKVNKRYVKKYKKIFKKSICGKKVKVVK